MVGRVRFQVWSTAKKCWRQVYVKYDMVHANVTLLRSYGMKFRVIE